MSKLPPCELWELMVDGGWEEVSHLQIAQKAQHITDVVVLAVLTSRGCPTQFLLSRILNRPTLR